MRTDPVRRSHRWWVAFRSCVPRQLVVGCDIGQWPDVGGQSRQMPFGRRRGPVTPWSGRRRVCVPVSLVSQG